MDRQTDRQTETDRLEEKEKMMLEKTQIQKELNRRGIKKKHVCHVTIVYLFNYLICEEECYSRLK